MYMRNCITSDFLEIIGDFGIKVNTPILRIGDQVLRFDVFWPKHLQEVRSTVYIHVQSM